MNDTEKTARAAVAVIGDDARQVRLAQRLASRGFKVTSPTDATESPPSDAVVLPVGHIGGGEIAACGVCAGRGSVVFAWAPPAPLIKSADENGWRLVDFSADEKLVVGNALITAEAALSIYMEKKEISVSGSRILVVGSGRVAKCVVRVFSSLRADVTLMARSERELALAAISGIAAVDIEDGDARREALSRHFDAVINTVPARVISLDELSLLDDDTLLIELASAPYGFDADEAAARGISAVLASSLPAKYAPASAAELIADAVERHFSGGAL